MVLDVDKNYLKERQYKSSGNLEARIAIHERFRTNPESFHGWIWDNMELSQPMRVLEVGCGTGQFWTENYKHVDEKSDLTLTDFSEGMIEKIKSKINHSNIKFEVADIEQLPYDDNTFDLVMAHHVIYHSSDKDKAISEAFDSTWVSSKITQFLILLIIIIQWFEILMDLQKKMQIKSYQNTFQNLIKKSMKIF